MTKNKPGVNSALIIILVFAFIKLVIHLYTNAFAGYGIFRDELYYFACSARPDLGYVDHPPFSIYILTLLRPIIGESVFAIRLISAILGALTVWLAGLIVRKMNGGIAAIFTTCTAVTLAPIYLGMNGFYSMNSFDIFFWTLAFYILILIWKEDKQKQWLTLGVVVGLGMLNKISMAWLVIGLIVAVLLTTKRKILLTRWPYLAGGIALLLFMPFVIWNLTHDFAHFEFMRNASQFKYSGVTRMDFIMGQILNMNPAAIIVWVTGLFYLLLNRKGRECSVTGIIYIVTLVILLINGHSKPEYIAPAFVPLLAAGGVQFEQWAQKKYLRWLNIYLPVSIALTGIFIIPLVLPVLPVEKYIAFTKTIGMAPKSPEGKQLSDLPQHFADMHGWENMAKTAAGVYHALPAEEQAKAVIYVRNYGEAGAMEYFREKYDLPKVICPHNNYWLWGWKEIEEQYTVAILVGGEQKDYIDFFEQVEQAGVVISPYAMPYETNLPIYIGRVQKKPIKSVWQNIKNFS